MITTQRLVWQEQDPPILDFDRSTALRDLPPLLSAYTEQSKINWLHRLGWAKRTIPDYAAPTAVGAVLMIPLLRRRQRWIALGVFLACVALYPVSRNAVKIVDALLPKVIRSDNHAYLDDYVQIDGVRITSYDDVSNTTIAAYDNKSFEGDGLRIIAFANRRVEAMPDDRARALFKAQGLRYPGTE